MTIFEIVDLEVGMLICMVRPAIFIASIVVIFLYDIRSLAASLAMNYFEILSDFFYLSGYSLMLIPCVFSKCLL